MLPHTVVECEAGFKPIGLVGATAIYGYQRLILGDLPCPSGRSSR